MLLDTIFLVLSILVLVLKLFIMLKKIFKKLRVNKLAKAKKVKNIAADSEGD